MAGQALLGPGAPNTVTQTGADAYQLAYVATSVEDYFDSDNVADLATTDSELVKPEKVTSAEVGYRGKFNKLTVDFSAYYNNYQDFISQESVRVPYYGVVGDGGLSIEALDNGDYQTYSNYTNSKVDVSSFGASIGLSMKVFDDFDLSGSYTYAKQDFDQEANPGFETNFNTPEHKFKASFGNTDLFENFGFNIAYRFSDDYYWEATFGNGVVPEFHTVDAQINYRIPKLKSTFKAGATNLLGDEYFTAFGTGFIGSMYYVGWTINNL